MSTIPWSNYELTSGWCDSVLNQVETDGGQGVQPQKRFLKSHPTIHIPHCGVKGDPISCYCDVTSSFLFPHASPGVLT